jgi:hypothetical protein
MFISQSPAADSHPIFSNLDSIARDSGLISRRSHKFSARGFLLSLLQSVTRGSCSLNQIAMGLGAFERDSMSRQALHKRFSAHSSIFLLQVIGSLLARRAHPRPRQTWNSDLGWSPDTWYTLVAPLTLP